MRKVKYKSRAKNILMYLRNRNFPISRVEILKHFEEKDKLHKGINNNERALNFLFQKDLINKFYSKKRRIMFKKK